MNSVARNFQPRSSRLPAQPDLYSCVVRYWFENGDTNVQPEFRWAQFADVSESGMKIISSKPHKVQIGEVLQVHFSLAGGAREVTTQARIVRKQNEFVFSVQFEKAPHDFKVAFFSHVKFVARLPWLQPFRQAKIWLAHHRRGLLFGVIAGGVFIFSISTIYHFSDSFSGKKSWWGTHLESSVDK